MPSVARAVVPSSRRPYHPTRAEQETVIRWDRGADSVRLVGLSGDLAPDGAPRPPARPADDHRRAAGRVLPDPPEPVPVGAEAGRGQGPRTPCSRWECGVAASSDTAGARGRLGVGSGGEGSHGGVPGHRPARGPGSLRGARGRVPRDPRGHDLLGPSAGGAPGRARPTFNPGPPADPGPSRAAPRQLGRAGLRDDDGRGAPVTA